MVGSTVKSCLLHHNITASLGCTSQMPTGENMVYAGMQLHGQKHDFSALHVQAVSIL
jgi:hypothetical protein